MSRPLLFVILAASLASACSKEGNEASAGSSGAASESQPSSQGGTGGGRHTAGSSLDPSLPLDRRVDSSIAEAAATYQKLTELRTKLFEDTIEQARAIVCSAYRILRLKSEYDPVQYRFDLNTGREFGGILATLLADQEMIGVSTLCYNEKKEYDCSYSCYEYQRHYGYCNYSLSSVRSSAYGGMALQAALGGMGTCSDRVHIADESNYKQQRTPNCDSVLWTCENHYMKPIPNSDRARAIEISTFSKIIATSIRRLKMYQDRLPVLEEQISTVSSFEATLIKLQKDLKYDMADTLSAEKNIKESDEFYNHALDSLDEFKRQLSVDIEIQQSEIEKISEVFGNGKSKGTSK